MQPDFRITLKYLRMQSKHHVTMRYVQSVSAISTSWYHCATVSASETPPVEQTGAGRVVNIGPLGSMLIKVLLM